MSEAQSSLQNPIDVVKARIFYLACDVEQVSPPAAMLLRAVADAIDADGALEAITAARMSNGASHEVSSESPTGPQSLDSRGQGAAQAAERQIEAAGPQAAQKR